MPAHSKLIDDGAVLIETVTRPTVDGKPGGSPLDEFTIHDGFYSIVQYDDNGNKFDVVSDDSTQDALTMENVPQFTSGTEWMFTAQWGSIKGAFTIVPKDGPNIDIKPKVCGTVCTSGFSLLVTARLSHIPVWQVRCDESRTYRRQDGSTETVNYFRIIGPFDGYHNQGVWRTDRGDWKLMGIADESWDPINPLQLYQLLPLGDVHPTVTGPGSITV
ncbi:hypothetical protein FRC06_009086 [Ceratobasidium sp. 370]|nr:hypothetical protein FRC06_009086 [Ceratobasidium sp. 370]